MVLGSRPLGRLRADPGPLPLTTVLIPWRGGCEHRARALEWVQARYRERFPRWRVVVAPAPPGPWIKALAVMAAAPTSGVVVVADADVWCDSTGRAVDMVRGGAPWALPHRSVYRLAPAASTQVMAGALPARTMACVQRPYRGTRGGGLVVLEAQVLREVPMDPGFVGWGGEDAAWGQALEALVGEPKRCGDRLYHLWHPPQERLSRIVGSRANAALAERYARARRRPEEMQALISEAHDRLHRQEGPLRGPPGTGLAGAPA